MTLSIPYSAFGTVRSSFSKLFVDYVAGGERANKLTQSFFFGDYRSKEVQQKKLEALSQTAYPRKQLVEILEQQNRARGASNKTLEQIQKFASSKTVAIVTGQQVGVLTGNLYTIYKTLSAIAFAKRMKQEFPDYEFVPIFWLEGEDHDYEEVATLSILVENKLHTLRYHEPSVKERTMTGRIRLSAEISQFATEVLAALAPSEFKPSVADLIRQTYREGETLLSAFAKMMSELFKDEGLVCLSSDERAYKRLCTKLFLKELSTAPESSANVIAQSALLEEAGYDAQAKAKPINLYLIEQHQRWRIEPQQRETYLLQPIRRVISKSELLELAEEAPERFSPNVLMRPIMQDWVVPTFAYVAGPAEVAYLAQLKSNYAFFGVQMPLVVPRHSLSLVEPKVKKVFTKLSELIAEKDRAALYAQFFADREQLTRQAIDRLEHISIEKLFAQTETQIKATLQVLGEELTQLDPTLKEALETASGKIFYQVGHLKEKAFRAEKQKHQDIIMQLEKCDTNLLPNHTLQERTINVCYYLNKFGFNLLKTLQQTIETHLELQHLVVEM
jgi:bacillithiol biosynthesis cysteine-adding enzyme BshC